MRFLGMPAAASGQYTAALSTSYVSWCHSKRSEESLMIFRRYAKTRPEMFEAGVSCFAFRCSASFNMTVMGQTAVTLQRFNGSLIDFHDKLALRIDVAAIHSVGVKRQCDLARFVDCDQTAGATQLFYGVESSLRRFLQREPPILH